MFDYSGLLTNPITSIIISDTRYDTFLPIVTLAVIPALANDTRKPPRNKPAKPYPGFLLFAHSNGRWCKKIRGKQFYFGLWSNPDAALQEYLEHPDNLHAGRTPRVQGDGLTLFADG